MICRECGDELPPAFAGRPRSYCSVTCRQRAYRRRKSVAAAAKATEEALGAVEAGGTSSDCGRSASAEAIVIRVKLDDPGGGSVGGSGGSGGSGGGGGRSTSAGSAGSARSARSFAQATRSAQDWGSLEELVQATMLIAHQLQARQQGADAPETGILRAEEAPRADPEREPDPAQTEDPLTPANTEEKQGSISDESCPATGET